MRLTKPGQKDTVNVDDHDAHNYHAVNGRMLPFRSFPIMFDESSLISFGYRKDYQAFISVWYVRFVKRCELMLWYAIVYFTFSQRFCAPVLNN